jgi:AcrR family transcriptional regulator
LDYLIQGQTGLDSGRRREKNMPEAKKKNNGSEFGIKPDSGRGISIGQLVDSVSRLTGQRCTPAMIYNYEKKGLLPPPARTEGGFRLFRIQDVHLVVCIKRCQMLGMSLETIKERIDPCMDDLEELEQELELPLDRRTQILEAAITVFPQKGYSATTLQDIAQEAGISASAIYQYFHSKEDLFLALTDNLSFISILDEINASLDEEKDIGYEDVRRSLIEVGEGFLGTHMRNAEIVRMFIAEARSFPEVGKRYCVRLVAPVEKLLNRYLSAQVKRGVLRPVNIELAVHSFYGIFLNFVVTQNLLVGEGILHFPKKDRVKQLVDIYLMGMFNPTNEKNPLAPEEIEP